MPVPAPWLNFAVALALGLLIGLERERGKGSGPGRRPAGIRTFTLASLLGALAWYLGAAPMLAVAVAGVALLAALARHRDRGADPGLTTEVALLLTPLLGALAMAETQLAAGLAASVAVVLAAKAPVHRFIRRVLTAAELRDGLILAAAALVVWPLLPDRSLGPWAAINPHMVWRLVVLVLSIGAAGYIATRLLGPRYGLPLSGLASGFVSSTATIGAMGARATRQPAIMAGAVAGATLSTLGTFIQMALLLWATSPPALLAATPALLAGGVVAALYGLGFTLRALHAPEAAEDTTHARLFSPKSALILAATMVVMLILAAGLSRWLGQAGMMLGAALAGVVDPHAAAISIAALQAGGQLAAADVVLPILAAMSTNAASKALMATSAGAPGYAPRVIPGLVLSLLAAWAAALVW